MKSHNEYKLVDMYTAKEIDLSIDVESGTMIDGVTISISGEEVVTLTRENNKTKVIITKGKDVEEISLNDD